VVLLCEFKNKNFSFYTYSSEGRKPFTFELLLLMFGWESWWTYYLIERELRVMRYGVCDALVRTIRDRGWICRSRACTWPFNSIAKCRFRTLRLQTALSIYYIFPFMHNAGGIRNVIW